MITEASEIQSITELAAEMMDTFLRTNGKPPRIRQWKDKYKSRAMYLLWKCHLEEVSPPVDLVMLVGCLFGERHDWPVAKFSAVNFLAQEYEPIELGQKLPEGAKSGVSAIIKEHGGIQKKARDLDDVAGNNDRDYRRTMDSWIEDPLFIYLWAQKFDKNQNRKSRRSDHDRAELLAVVKKALLALNSTDS